MSQTEERSTNRDLILLFQDINTKITATRTEWMLLEREKEEGGGGGSFLISYPW